MDPSPRATLILICPKCRNRLSNAVRLPARRKCPNRACAAKWSVDEHPESREPVYVPES